MSSGARWAVYYAPPEATPLWRFGVAWLGRDPVSGRGVPQPAVDGLSAARLHELTADPRFYGFHATLKPPFALAEGESEQGLMDAAAAFAAMRQPFEAGPLRVSRIGRFTALTLASGEEGMRALAAAAVTAFDRFRAPPEAADLARRRQKGLSARQEELLTAWGYPYVMEEFRFHMTLTGSFDDEDAARAIDRAVTRGLGSELDRPLPVTGIALYRQPDCKTSFQLVLRLPFGP